MKNLSQNCPDSTTLADWIVGAVSEEIASNVIDHLSDCEPCNAWIEQAETDPKSLIVMLRNGLGHDYRARRGLPLDQASWKDQFPEFAEMIEEAIAAVSKEPPQRIGPYELREKLGQGGMGAVYKAWHSRLRRYVAIKLLPPETANDPQLLARFDREMQAVGKLSHPNVVAASDADFRDGVHFLAMEYCDGMDLSNVIKRLGPIGVPDACEIICQVADGLQHAHQHGLLHRDIKPSNLMLSRDGVVRILDMGLARLNTTDTHELTSVGQVVGTFDFMSPEQASASETIDVRSDIYSVGMTLYVLLTGRLPFEPARYDTVIKKLVAKTTVPAGSVANHRDDLPTKVVQACDRMLKIDPALRFSEAQALRAELLPYCQGANLIQLIEAATKPTQEDRQACQLDETTLGQGPQAAIDTVSLQSSGLSFGPQPQPAVPPVQSETSTEITPEQMPQPSFSTSAHLVTRARRSRKDEKSKWLAGGLVGLLMCGLIGLWTAGMFTFTLKTPAGTLEIKSNGDTFATSMQGKQLTIKNTETGETYNIDLDKPQESRELDAGAYVVMTTASGLITHTNHFTIRSGETESIEVTWKPDKSNPASRTPDDLQVSGLENDAVIKREIAAALIERGAVVTFLQDVYIVECDRVAKIPADPAFRVHGVRFDAGLGHLTAAEIALLAKLGSDYQLTIKIDLDLNTMRQVTQLPLDYLHVTLTNAGSDVLEQLATMTTLQHLSTDGVTSEQLQKLEPLAPHLKTLVIYSAGIHGEDFVDIGKFDQLVGLNLVLNSDLTDAVIPSILPLRSLTDLNLQGAKVTDAGILGLANMTSLRNLSLAETQCTHEGIAKLRELLPKCNINFPEEL